MTKCEYIRENVSMRELLEKYGFKFSRKNFICCCFHNEKTPSACVSKDDRWYICYGCGVSYNTIDFVANYEKCSRSIAIAKIDEMFSLGLGNNLTSQQKKELQKVQHRYRLLKEKQEREKQEEQIACNKIIEELRTWEQIQKDTHPTRGQIRNNTWELSDLFFHSLKQQKWLCWLYDKICEFDHKECEYDYTILDNKRELVKKVLNYDMAFLSL